MVEKRAQMQSFSRSVAQWMKFCEQCLTAINLDELSENVLSNAVKLLAGRSIFLYVVDPHMAASYFYQNGFCPEVASEIEERCKAQCDQISQEADQDRLSQTFSLSLSSSAAVRLYPLWDEARCVGVMGSEKEEGSCPQDRLEIRTRLVRFVAIAIIRLLERQESQRKLSHLNTYLTVSSMLAQSLDLDELLEAATYCSMQAVSAEAASVLLLDAEKKNFLFYQVEGIAKPLLKGETFPADTGIAGFVLKEQHSLIFDDPEHNPRFYEQVDLKTGFHTRNMIAVPLVAGEEQVGVLEVLNKAGGGSFLEEERLLLVSIAEEIAFAIRNARIFEFVVESYCKRLQGQLSCKGCERPLGSWTPCQRYRVEGI